MRKDKLISEISMENPEHWRADLSEVRADLYDNRINFLGLSPLKSINYLNIEDHLTKNPVWWPKFPITVDLYLSMKVTY